MDQLPRLGKRELICLLSFTCNYVVSVWRGFLFLWVLGMGYVILLWHSLSLPYNYFLVTLYVTMLFLVCVSPDRTTEDEYFNLVFDILSCVYLRNRSALAVNCCVIIHCLEVSCKEDQITSAQRE